MTLALGAVLEADLRAIATEARRRFPSIKDAAEHAILKVGCRFRARFDDSHIYAPVALRGCCV